MEQHFVSIDFHVLNLTGQNGLSEGGAKDEDELVHFQFSAKSGLEKSTVDADEEWM